MSQLILPKDYKSPLDLRQTELAIKCVKDFFQSNLSAELRLRRVTAPLFVLKGMGINDDLNGIERPVTFNIKDLNEAQAEVVHSLAKWKRITLADYAIEKGYGLYTDMNAIRADEELDNIHSLYVDQWDWELVIDESQRTVSFLKEVVRRLYAVMVRTEYALYEMFPSITPILPANIFFIHSEELLQLYPDKTPKERENLITKEHGAVPSTPTPLSSTPVPVRPRSWAVFTPCAARRTPRSRSFPAVTSVPSARWIRSRPVIPCAIPVRLSA